MSTASPSGAGSGTKAQRVYRAVRDDILDGRILSGVALDEVELAAAFEVSRTPVREALRLLQSDGLLQSGPRRQLLVADFSPVRRREVSVARSALECAAVDDACRLRTDDDIDRLRLCAMRQRRAADADDAQRFFELDEEFHHALVGLAQMPTLTTLLAQLGAFVRLARFSLDSDHAHLHGLVDEHEQLIEALETGDAGGLRERLDAHIKSTDRRTGSG